MNTGNTVNTVGKIIKAEFGMTHDRVDFEIRYIMNTGNTVKKPFLQVDIELENGVCFKFLAMNQIYHYLTESFIQKGEINVSSIEEAFIDKKVTLRVDDKSLVQEILTVNDIELCKMSFDDPNIEEQGGFCCITQLHHTVGLGGCFIVNADMSAYSSETGEYSDKYKIIVQMNIKEFNKAVIAFGKMNFGVTPNEQAINCRYVYNEVNGLKYVDIFMNHQNLDSLLMTVPMPSFIRQ